MTKSGFVFSLLVLNKTNADSAQPKWFTSDNNVLCARYFLTTFLPSHCLTYLHNLYMKLIFDLQIEMLFLLSVSATYVHQTSDGTSFVITSEPTSFDTNSSVSMTTISESNPSLVSTSETVDTTGIPLEQFTTHHTHQVDHEDHSTLFVLQDDSGGQDQEV